jgi:Tol biopolymer transport system component
MKKNKSIYSFLSYLFFGVFAWFIFLLTSSTAHTNDPAISKEQVTEQSKIQGYQPVISNIKQLTFEGTRSGEGYFSADGKKMIFQSERPNEEITKAFKEGNPFYQIYLMDLESGKTKLLSPGFGQTTCAWVHPSMKKVLFSSTHLDPDWKEKQTRELEMRKTPQKQKYSWSFDENYEIFTMDLTLNSAVKSAANVKYKQVTHAKGYDAESSFSPDGKKIVFASNRAAYDPAELALLSEEDKKYLSMDPSYLMDIYIMDADGSNVKRLTDTKGYDGGPFFSADGKKITWRRFAPNGQSAEIYVMDVDGKNQKAITHLGVMSWAPFFHPSGDYIIFTSNLFGYGNFELFIVDTLGEKKPVRVTQLDGFDGLPTFSPSGEKISWTRRNEKGESQIFIANWNDQLAREALGLSQKPLNLSQVQTQLSPGIQSKDVQLWVQYLSSLHLEGRKPGTAAEDEYMNLIAQSFQNWKLQPWSKVNLHSEVNNIKSSNNELNHTQQKQSALNRDFFQPFEFSSGVKMGEKNQLEMALSQGLKKLELGKDFIPMSFSNIQYQLSKAVPVIFAGYGLDIPASEKFEAYNSYQGLDVDKKWVLVFKDIPEDIPNEKRIHFNMFSRLNHKVLVAKNKGALGVIFIGNPGQKLKDLSFQGGSAGGTNESSLPVVEITYEVAMDWLKNANDKSSVNLDVLKTSWDKGEIIHPDWSGRLEKAQVDLIMQTTQSKNLVAVIPGPDAGRKNEKIVFIGAHGDHLGRGEMGSSLAKDFERNNFHTGADDNASGVSGVLELAHYFANKYKSQKPPVTLAFGVWSAEEVGVIGSSKFLKTIPTEKIKAYINMDMIGRLRDSLQIQGVGSSLQWKPLIEQALVDNDLSVKLTEDPYLPTDSMSFYLAKIPAISFFTGAHEDYHSPRDVASKINVEGLVKTLEVVKVITEKAMLNPIKYEAVASQKGALEGRRFRIFLGTIPDYSQEGVQGVRISGASKDSPAAVAGLQANDIIVELNQQKIENLYDYVYALQLLKAGKEAVMKIKRPQATGVFQELDLKIVPALKE